MADGSSIIEPSLASPAEDMRAVRSRMLLRMAEIVLDVAEMVREEVREVRAEGAAAREAGEPAAEVAPRLRLAPVDVGLTLSRLSRAMRLTLALQKRFDEEALVFAEKEKAKADALAAEAADKAYSEQQFLDGMRENKHEAVAIAKAMATEQGRERGVDPIDHEALFAELDERLEDDSDLEALGDYSMVDLVCVLCAKLGVPFDPATVGHSDKTLRKEWLDDLPDPPLKPPDHPGWAS